MQIWKHFLTCCYFLFSKLIDAVKYYLELLYIALQMHHNTKHFLSIVQNIYICSSLTSDCPISLTNKVPQIF